MAERVADLHSHTTFSDGTETPERVIELANAAGLSAIAITDHDTMEAYDRAEAAAARWGVELIPGIEMSASVNEKDVHMLGYFLDRHSPALQTYLAAQKTRRQARAREMVRRLQATGLKLDAEEVFRVAGDGTIGRPHLARVLVRHGYVATMAEAFEKYLGDDGPGFVPGSPIQPGPVIQVIREAGGVPVLAHPIFLGDEGLVDRCAKEGLAGLEVYHSSHTPKQMRHYEEVADRLALLRTGGSDYHGDAKEGLPIGAVHVPYALVEALRTWKGRATSV